LVIPVVPALAALDGGAIGKYEIDCGWKMSPRMSICVCRSRPYAVPPAARVLLVEIVVIRSLSVRFAAASFWGSTTTSYAGVAPPPTDTYETSGICEMYGTTRLFAISESWLSVSVVDVIDSVTTVASLGSRTLTVGGCKSVGSECCAVCSDFSTLTRSVLTSDVM
jgi:hypothetical protein